MKRLVQSVFVTLALLVLATAAEATQITVSSAQIPNWQHSNTAPRLRIYLNKPVNTSDGRVLPSGSALSAPSNFYQSVTCSVAGGVLTIPQFTIDSLTDALVNPDAVYSAWFYTSSGQQISQYSGFSKFTVPPTPTTTTWSAILTFNTTFVPFIDNLTYNRTQIDAKIAAVQAGATSWGAIIGTLTSQTDLQAALDAKVPTTRTITPTAPLTGGGALSGNLSLGIPVATGSQDGYLDSADWSTFNSKQAALGFTPENAANKNAASGYPGLTAGKVAASQVQEVLALADLSDLTGKKGNSTIVQLQTGATATDDCAKFDANGNLVSAGAPCGSGSGAVDSVFGRTGVVVAVTNDYTWAQINKATSSLADITTRSAADLSSGTLPDARLSANVPLLNAANNEFTGTQTINPGTTPVDDALLIDMAQPVAPGARNSHGITIRGTSFDTVGHNLDWQNWTQVSDNDGSGTLYWSVRNDSNPFSVHPLFMSFTAGTGLTSVSVRDVLIGPSIRATTGFRNNSTQDNVGWVLRANGSSFIGAQLQEADLGFTDIATNNASTSAHGYLKKLSNVATEYMDGTGNWTVPSLPTGGGGGVSGSATYDPPNLLNGQSDTVTVTVTGASVGDVATVSFTTALPAGVWFSSPQITAADTAKVTLVNESGGAVDVASGTIKISTVAAQNLFSSIPVSGQTTVTANSIATALTFVAGSGMTITTDNTAKTITFVSSGGGGGGSPAGSGSEIQARLDASTFQAVTGSSISGAQITLADKLTTALDNATTNAVDVLADLQHSSSGTPAAGFGTRLRFGLESTTTANQDAAAVNAFWSTATHSGRTSRMGLATVNDGGTPGTLANKVVIGNDAAQTMFMKLQNQDTLSSGDLVKLYLSDSGFMISAGFGAPLTIANSAGTNIVYNVGFPSKHSLTVSAVEVLAIDNSVIITPAANSVKGLQVKAASGQTANLQEWQDNSGTALMLVGPTGVLRLKVVAFADLPGSPAAGDTVGISDSNVSTFGATITAGGGANKGLAYYDGTNWTFR